MFWRLLKYVGLAWVALRLLGHVVGVSKALIEEDAPKLVEVATAAATDGVIVLVLVAIAVPFVLPGAVRLMKIRRRFGDIAIVVVVANAEFRELLMRAGVELSLREGRFAPRILYSATLTIDRAGARVWAGLGDSVGLIPAGAVESVAPSREHLGLLSPPAMAIQLTDGRSARFVVGTDRFPWLTSLDAKGVERAARRFNEALRTREPA